MYDPQYMVELPVVLLLAGGVDSVHCSMAMDWPESRPTKDGRGHRASSRRWMHTSPFLGLCHRARMSGVTVELVLISMDSLGSISSGCL